MLFLAPLLGLAVGAAPAPRPAPCRDAGVDDTFLKQLGEQLEPGRAALVVLVREMTPRTRRDALAAAGKA